MSELLAPTPVYSIGQTIYVAVTERTTEQLDCPDCLGSKVWAVTSPAGESFTTACPRCQNTYSLRNSLPSLNVERHVAKAQARVITGLEINARTDTWTKAVVYKSAISGSSHYTIDEDKAHATEESALAEAQVRADELNGKAAETPQTLTSQHFQSLTFNEARWDELKTGVWNSHYHAGNLFECVRVALGGEDGDEERADKDVIEDLREAVRWDFKYHVDNLPLTDLIKAASESSDDAVKASLASLPENMVALLSGKTLAEMAAA